MGFRPPCTYCVKNFLRKKYLQVHIKNKHTIKVKDEFVCLICGKRLMTRRCMKAHMNTDHFKETDRIVVFGCSDLLNSVKVG